MHFGTFLDPNGDFLDTVHFPQIALAYPFYGKGIYRLEGKITAEYDYYTLEVRTMVKLPFMEDIRISLNQEDKQQKANQEART